VVESAIAAMVAAFGAAGHALADKRMTESDEERASLSERPRPRNGYRSRELSFRGMTPGDCPKIKPPQVREATVRHVENRKR
jgi:hypothetical protein